MPSDRLQNSRRPDTLRKILGLLAVLGALLLTMANSAGPTEYYERELLSGGDIVLEDEAWEESADCLPPVALKEAAAKVRIDGSQNTFLASAQCKDGSNCMERINSFVDCHVNNMPEASGTEGESTTPPPLVTCTVDKEAASATTGTAQGVPHIMNDIKKCNDELRITVEFSDGSVKEARFRQLFVTESHSGYNIFYPH